MTGQLHALHGHCRDPGCDRPAAWTDAAHLHQWATTHTTDYTTTLPLCRAHHTLLDTTGWTVHYDPDTATCIWTSPDHHTRIRTRPPDPRPARRPLRSKHARRAWRPRTPSGVLRPHSDVQAEAHDRSPGPFDSAPRDRAGSDAPGRAAVDRRTVRWLEDLRDDDADSVGAKNASLGELTNALGHLGIRVPPGFATTTDAYRQFLEENDLRPVIRDGLKRMRSGDTSATADIRQAIRTAPLPQPVARAVVRAYRRLSERCGEADVDVAVRSSGTAGALPAASFAGLQETFLNVRGEAGLLDAVRGCFASLYTDRSIAYRDDHGHDHLDVAVSVGVQRMVRSDLGAAGVMFTIDMESSFPGVVSIDASWGLGTSVVAGTVNPDHYLVFKPVLDQPGCRPVIGRETGDKKTKVVYAEQGDGTRTVETTPRERGRLTLDDDEVLRLASWAVRIEDHYGRPMDIEWAKHGRTGDLLIVQARPETVRSRRTDTMLRTYSLRERGEILASGVAIGDSIAVGSTTLVTDPGATAFEDGSVLVTARTDPDWVPLMRRAAAVVTDLGGRTAHAAIVSRELGLPAVVGVGDATTTLEPGRQVTVSCAEGETGYVYDGALPFTEKAVDLDGIPDVRTQIMLNIADPRAALRWWRLPARGVGLARMEFIVSNHLTVHPLALTRYDDLQDDGVKDRIDALTRGYDDRTEFFVDRLAQGIAQIAASQHPHRVIVRMSDFKTDEYADLLGGAQFEPAEQNPMIGFRGAVRYYSPRYADGFGLECRAMRRVREQMGLGNVALMIPFVRTVAEADRIIEVLAGHGLERGRDGLELWMACEVPANVVLAGRFAPRFDGFSIGSNDLTQLVLGVDRDSPDLADLFDERDEAVTRTIAQLIGVAHDHGVEVGICGQGPSDYPEFAAFLVGAGIDAMSLNPDSIVEVIHRVAAVEAGS